MNDQEIIEILKKLNYTEEQLKAWQSLLSNLKDDDKKPLIEKLQAYKSQKNTLAVEQANMIADFIQKWKQPAQ